MISTILQFALLLYNPTPSFPRAIITNLDALEHHSGCHTIIRDAPGAIMAQSAAPQLRMIHPLHLPPRRVGLSQPSHPQQAAPGLGAVKRVAQIHRAALQMTGAD
jgi:hypothetical protein